MNSLYPSSIKIVHQLVKNVNPENNYITIDNGDQWIYKHLIVASGNVLDFGTIKGALEALEDKSYPVGSIYNLKYAEKMNLIGK